MKSAITMAARVTQLLNAIKPRVPLIKFRKNAPLSPRIDVPVSSSPVTAQPIVEAAAPSAIPAMSERIKSIVVAYEWWDTPSKFKRRQIDDLEIDIVNSGGSDRLYH